MKKFIPLQVRVMVLILLSSSIFFSVNSCKKTTEVPGANEVFIQGNAFNPSTITVSAGTTITWTNKDGVTHTVTGTGTTVFPNSPSIGSNGTFSQLFSTAGTYPYKCTVHPTMTGTVVVN